MATFNRLGAGEMSLVIRLGWASSGAVWTWTGSGSAVTCTSSQRPDRDSFNALAAMAPSSS